VSVQPQKTFGKDRQSIVRLRNVSLPVTVVAGRAGAAWPRLERLRQRLAALLCADMVGGADAVLEMTTRYVCEREQFGVKLGTFQAVQQMVAVMAIDLEGARHVTRHALWRLAEGLPADRELAIAKAWTGRAYRDITLAAHQLHGGAGYIVEHDLHRYSARAKEAELRFGSTEEWLAELAGVLRLGRDGA
jgi:alkylation response protein AidB-like acyl-CoA dehydrogenase